jgi:DNA-binding XRE family transcriptional regulator
MCPVGNFLESNSPKVPKWVHFHQILTPPNIIFPLGNMVCPIMTDNDESTADRRASEAASAFGSLIRSRRKALKMRQDQLALATGVGRRFLIDLEAGKPSCQLGRSLLVADVLGLRLADMPTAGGLSATAQELPDLPEEVEE